VQVISVVIVNIDIVRGVPVVCPILRPGIDEHEPIVAVPEAGISANDDGAVLNAEPVLTPEIEAETTLGNVITAIAAALIPSSVVDLPMRGAILLPGGMFLPSAVLRPTALLLPFCGLLLGALLRRIVALSLRIFSLCALHWRRLRRLRTLRYFSASRLLLALLWSGQIRLLLGALSLLRPWRGLRPLPTLFRLQLALRLRALSCRRLRALLWLRSALLPLRAGLAFRPASLFAFVCFVVLLAPLCKAGRHRPGKQDQGGRLHYSYQFHGRCLRARDTITWARTTPTRTDCSPIR
jgi:hypothetical protein